MDDSLRHFLVSHGGAIVWHADARLVVTDVFGRLPPEHVDPVGLSVVLLFPRELTLLAAHERARLGEACHGSSMIFGSERPWLVTPRPDGAGVQALALASTTQPALDANQSVSDIVHDLNNLLMNISGSAGLALMHLPPSSPATADLRSIEAAAQKAGGLTRPLISLKHSPDPRQSDESPTREKDSG